MATRTRNRTSRLAVLDSSVRRPTSSSPKGRSRNPLVRRAVVVTLVVLSLVLITISFRESSGGPLHGVQNVGASVMKPFEVAANRVARPFQDAYGWFSGLVTARSENAKLKKEVEQLRQRYATAQTAENENASLKRLLHYESGPSFPRNYKAVNASVLARGSADVEERIVVSAGSSQGVRVNDPVVTTDGLIGRVTRVAHGLSSVTLLTDPTSSVAASDLTSKAYGLIDHGPSGGTQLVFDRVSKEKVVNDGDYVVTAGTQLASLPDIYPRGILIGRVTSVYQNNVDEFKHVQVQPFADFSSLDSVAILVPLSRR